MTKNAIRLRQTSPTGPVKSPVYVAQLPGWSARSRATAPSGRSSCLLVSQDPAALVAKVPNPTRPQRMWQFQHGEAMTSPNAKLCRDFLFSQMFADALEH